MRTPPIDSSNSRKASAASPGPLRALFISSTGAILALAAVLSCGGLTPGVPINILPGDGGSTSVGGSNGQDGGLGAFDASSDGSDAGDAGQDGGLDAGADGGFDAGDAGCTSFTTNHLADGCFSPGHNTLQLIVSGCGPSATLYLDNAAACSGTVGPHDSFSGVCQSPSRSCQASSLPGTIVCQAGPDAGSCSIVVCDPNATACP